MSLAREIGDIWKAINWLKEQIPSLPTRAHSSVGGGSVAEAEKIWYEEPTKAELPDDVAETALGRVTDGDDKGMCCVRNPDNDGWDAFTHFE